MRWQRECQRQMVRAAEATTVRLKTPDVTYDGPPQGGHYVLSTVRLKADTTYEPVIVR